MNAGLYRLVYLSDNRIPDTDDLHDQIEAIITGSRKRNAAVGVTGALLFNGKLFAQVLEGEHDAVQLVFERIQCDSRHANVRVLQFEPVAERGFDAWSMAYIGDPVEKYNIPGAETDTAAVDDSRLNGDRIYRLLREYLDDGMAGRT